MAVWILQTTNSSSKRGRVRRMSRYVGDSETGVDCNLCGDGKNEDAEAVIRDQAAQSPRSHDLGCHEGVHQHSLEQRSDDARMHRWRLRGRCGRCSIKASVAIALRGSKMACTMRNSWVSSPTAAFLLRARNVWRGENAVQVTTSMGVSRCRGVKSRHC